MLVLSTLLTKFDFLSIPDSSRSTPNLEIDLSPELDEANTDSGLTGQIPPNQNIDKQTGQKDEGEIGKIRAYLLVER